MPSLNDYDKDEGDQPDIGMGSVGSSPASGGSANAPRQAQSSPQQEQAYVPWSRFTSANQGVSDREAGNLNSQVSGDIGRAKDELQTGVDANNNALESNYNHFGPAQPTRAEMAQNGKQNPTQTVNAKGAFGPMSSGNPVEQAGPRALPMGRAPTDAKGRPTGPASPLLTAAPSGSRTGLTDQAAAGNLAGSKDLETAFGPTAWAKLGADTGRATDEANALGSQKGVQGLLQQGASAPMVQGGAFDAALINGAGQKQFGETAQTGKPLYQNAANALQGSQQAWSSLSGQSAAAQKQSADAKSAADAAAIKGGSGGAGAAAPSYGAGDPVGSMNHNLDPLRTANDSGRKSVLMGLGLDPTSDPNKWGQQWVDALTGKAGDPNNPNDAERSARMKNDAKSAEAELGISDADFIADVGKMSGNELGDFWAFGVVPPWMGGTGQVGGWHSPYMQSALQFGSDGGMWNAVTNMWKQGVEDVVTGAAGGVGGEISTGVKVANKGANPNPGKK
jgi:hypothetical protein